MTLLADLGIAVHTDASAAIGIVRSSVLVKLRHLNVRHLWLQDQARTGAKLAIAKVPGVENQADVVTKSLNSEATQRHLDELHITRSGGRAQSAPTLAGLAGPRCEVTDERASGAADEHGARGATWRAPA